MAARDIYHQTVKEALIKDGWQITHDPFSIRWSSRRLEADLGAQRLLAAERATQKIVVEVKSFLRDSRVVDLEDALGQYVLYEEILKRTHPDRELYLAMPNAAFFDLFEKDDFAQILIDSNRLKVMVFNPSQQEIQQWLP
ncbi:MAG: element excision factor XisH family protein [Cyanobacteria bacterium P01_C01_bin.89]